MFFEEKQERYVYCSRCGGEIYDPEPYGMDDGKPVCEDCMNAEWEDASISAKADFLGLVFTEWEAIDAKWR